MIQPVNPARGRLVGRVGALAEFQARLRMVSASQRQVVFITGESGIGKTAMVDELQRRAANEVSGLRIARGHCLEGEAGQRAYFPVLGALEQLCLGDSGASLVETLAAEAPTWLVQFSALVTRERRETLQQEILGVTRERMLREICEALETVASQTPLLLVLEDVQWVDRCTVDLISALARRRGPAKLMLIATYRPVDLALSDHPLKAVKQDLLVHQLCHELDLEPLPEAEIAAFLDCDSVRAATPEGLAELIHRHSEGNPQFMIAALEHLTQRGLIARENGSWQLRVPLEEIDLKVPETLRHMIEAQIERLSPREQRALEAASVAGNVFGASVAAGAIGQDIEDLEDLYETLARRHRILRSAGSQQFPDGSCCQRYEFVHALYCEVLYQRQPLGQRAKLHQRVAERLEALFSS